MFVGPVTLVDRLTHLYVHRIQLCHSDNNCHIVVMYFFVLQQ